MEGYTVQKEETGRLHRLRDREQALDLEMLGEHNHMEAQMGGEVRETEAMSAEEGGWRHGEEGMDVDVGQISSVGHEYEGEEDFVWDEPIQHDDEFQDLRLGPKSPTTLS
jgi:hypothetical protein